MTWVDIQIVVVGLAAMLEPATLASSVLALVVGDRPLRTGFWFYVGGLGATLSVGVLAAFVLGNAAASSTETLRTWVSVFGLGLVMLLLAPDRAVPALARVRGLVERHARTIAMILVVAVAVSLAREGVSGLAS